jgi:hypothetical protein
VEECKIMKALIRIDPRKGLLLKLYLNKISTFITIHNQSTQIETMELMTTIHLPQLCLQHLIKKYFSNIGILLTLNLIIKAIESLDLHKKV